MLHGEAGTSPEPASPRSRHCPQKVGVAPGRSILRRFESGTQLLEQVEVPAFGLGSFAVPGELAGAVLDTGGYPDPGCGSSQGDEQR